MVFLRVLIECLKKTEGKIRKEFELFSLLLNLYSNLRAFS